MGSWQVGLKVVAVRGSVNTARWALVIPRLEVADADPTDLVARATAVNMVGVRRGVRSFGCDVVSSQAILTCARKESGFWMRETRRSEQGVPALGWGVASCLGRRSVTRQQARRRRWRRREVSVGRGSTPGLR